MKIRKNTIFVGILLAAVLAFVVAHYILISQSMGEDRVLSIMKAARIHDAIEAQVEGPIMVATVMARDIFLEDFMEKDRGMASGENTGKIQAYLREFKESVGFETAFAVSGATKRYYTQDGYMRILAPKVYERDYWYERLEESEESYSIEIREDEDNGKAWSVFVMRKVLDSDGNMVGACGVGMEIGELQKIFERFEQDYKLTTSVVDKNGIIQLDSAGVDGKQAFHNNKLARNERDYIYTKIGRDGYAVTKYLDRLGWYMIAERADGAVADEPFPVDFVLIGVGIFIMVFIGFVALYGDDGGRRGFAAGSPTDQLTGLPNRNYFKEVYGERGIFNTTRYKAIAVYDIDFFKEANDTMDGDMVLKKVTEAARQIIGGNGEIFRWGGDEFAVLMEWSIDFAYEICREFCREVEKQGFVTISIGVTEVRLSDTIKKNYYRAAQGCYLVKEMGGNGVKRC